MPPANARRTIPNVTCAREPEGGWGTNPNYAETFVFTNDYPASYPTVRPSHGGADLCFEPVGSGDVPRDLFQSAARLTLPRMAEEQIEVVVGLWAVETAELGSRYRWVQVFENKGAVMGCSNPHPHGQIWACDCLPNEPGKEDRQQESYWREHAVPLLVDYLAEELRQDERVVLADEHWAVVVPYWATWPFETLLLPRRHVLRLPDLTATERSSLARVLKRFLTRYDNLFETSSPIPWAGMEPRIHGRFALATPRAFLPAAAAIGDREEVHGRLRDARRSPTGLDPRASREPFAGASRSPLPRS